MKASQSLPILAKNFASPLGRSGYEAIVEGLYILPNVHKKSGGQ